MALTGIFYYAFRITQSVIVKRIDKHLFNQSLMNLDFSKFFLEEDSINLENLKINLVSLNIDQIRDRIDFVLKERKQILDAIKRQIEKSKDER